MTRTTDATNLGIPGWYLWSDVTTLTTSTGGANSHAQFRYGGGNRHYARHGLLCFFLYYPEPTI